MATSAISHAVGAANSKMAQAIREQEEREIEMRSKGGRDTSRQKPEEKSRGGKRKSGLPKTKPARLNRWQEQPTYSQPSPMTDRLKNDAGATSFHFSVIKVGKESSPTFNGKPLRGYETESTKAARHEAYISRDNAPEIVAAAHAAYLERADAPERTPGAFAASDTNGVNIDDIGEDVDGVIAVDHRGVPSIFSNISDSAEERIEFWKAVHNSERNAKIHSLIIDARKDPEWIRYASQHQEFPEALRETFSLALADLQAFERGDATTYRPRTYAADSEKCGRYLIEAGRLNPDQQFTPALQFKSGAGGTVQHRFVVELPHELNPAERAALAKRFCEHLGNLEQDENGQPRGMMYTGVVHAPDAHNDSRNYHLHVVAHDRPAKFIPEFGKWDFEIESVFERKGEIRVKYPYRQNKLKMVNQSSAVSRRDDSGANFIPAMRRAYCDMANEAMAAAGIEKRYDARSYKAMGIERAPTTHLGTKAAALEAAGVPTQVGTLNAQIIWADALKRAERNAAKRKKAQAKTNGEMLARNAQWRSSGDSPQAFREFNSLTAEHSRIIADIADDALLIETFDIGEAKARSRALKVRATALQTLVDIENGVAPKTDVRSKHLVQKRFHTSNEWLDAINKALENDRPAINAARRDVLAREERLVHIEKRLSELWLSHKDSVARALREPLSNLKFENPDIAKPAPSEIFIDYDGTVHEVKDLPAQPIVTTPKFDKPQAETTPITTTAGNHARPAETKPISVTPNEETPQAAKTAIISTPGRDAPQTETSQASVTPRNEAPQAETKSTEVAPTTATPQAEKQTATINKDAPQSEKKPIGVTTNKEARQEETKPTPTEKTPINSTTDKGAQHADTQPIRLTPTKEPPPVEKVPITATSKKDTPEAEPKPVAVSPTAKPANTTEPEKKPTKPAPAQSTLFDLPEQAAPTKPGTRADLNQSWEAVFAKIQSEHLFILPDEKDSQVLKVPKLSAAETAVLMDPMLIKRSMGRLKAMKEFQDQTVDRLKAWLLEHMHDEEKIQFASRTVKLLDAPKSVKTFMERYSYHPTIVAVLEKGVVDRARIATLAKYVDTEGRSPAKLDLANRVANFKEAPKVVMDVMNDLGRTPMVKKILRREFDRREKSAADLREKMRRPESIGVLAPNYTGVRFDAIKNENLADLVALLNINADMQRQTLAAQKVARDAEALDEVYRHGEPLAVAFTRLMNQRPVTHQAVSREKTRDF